MGLDIQIVVNNIDEVFDSEYISNFEENRKLTSLSRDFCNFMCRRDSYDHKAELDQIGEIANLNIQPLYDMNQNSLEDLEQDSFPFKDNIDIVLFTIQGIKRKLEAIPDIYSRLIPTHFDTLNNEYYFSKFNEDLGDGYIGNNFGQDIRNFERLLLLAKSKGTTTVGFYYG